MSASLRRRRLLQAAGLLGLPGVAGASTAEGLALHAMNRLGYGPRPGELANLARGFDWQDHVEQQLRLQPLGMELLARLQALAARQRPQHELVRAYRDQARAAQADEGRRDALRRLVRQQLLDAAEARLLRALQSPNQLEERLVEFWFNHFNVFANKGLCRVLIGPYETEAIRPHVLGRFRDLLGATAKHPAMLFYLDNWLSSGEGASGRRSGLNENYARELMELHTLGVDAGYTQRDVTELARVLTGWTIAARGAGGFRFDAGRHDAGAKTWLGQAVPGRGQAQGEWVLDHLARHPRTAQRIAFKLAQCFVADQPEPALVEASAKTFLASDGDLRATTRTLLLHPASRDAAVRGAQFKSPYRYVLSLLRAVGHTPEDEAGWRPVLQALRGLGQPLFGCVTPDGWKSTRETWLDPEALARRSEIASRLAERLRPSPQDLLATLGPTFGERTRAAVAGEPPRLQAALLLASPDFQNA